MTTDAFDDFKNWLVQERGLQGNTAQVYKQHAQTICKAVEGREDDLDFVIGFIARESVRIDSARSYLTAYKKYAQFLHSVKGVDLRVPHPLKVRLAVEEASANLPPLPPSVQLAIATIKDYNKTAVRPVTMSDLTESDADDSE